MYVSTSLKCSALAPSLPRGWRISACSFSAFVLLLTISSLAFAILSSSQLAQGTTGPTDRWDRYTLRVGLESRKTFARTVAKYSLPSHFPVPFNILSLVLVRIPKILIFLLQKSEWIAGFEKLETALWSVLVLPLSLVLSGFWLWGYV